MDNVRPLRQPRDFCESQQAERKRGRWGYVQPNMSLKLLSPRFELNHRTPAATFRQALREVPRDPRWVP